MENWGVPGGLQKIGRLQGRPLGSQKGAYLMKNVRTPEATGRLETALKNPGVPLVGWRKIINPPPPSEDLGIHRFFIELGKNL